MKVAGLQKLTLIDYPGKLACTIFLHGCNFKCGFCHNPELVLDNEIEEIPQNEVLDFLEKRKKYIEGVCFTGGEPLLSIDKEFLKKVKELGYLIKIDTNGCFPEILKKLIDESLVDYIAMDVKTNKGNYELVVGAGVDFDKLEESMKLISNFPEYEFRTTILESLHKKEDVEEMMEWLVDVAGKKLKRFRFQGFKNLGKLINPELGDEKNTSEKYLNELVEIAKDYFEDVKVRV